MNKIVPFGSLIKDLISVRRNIGKDFMAFRKTYFAHYHKNPDGRFQKEISRILARITRKRQARIAIAAPRHFSKSTIVTLEYVIYCICYKLENFILIASHTFDQASGFLRDIKSEFEKNELLLKDFPELFELGKKTSASKRWSASEIITPNGVKVLALGVQQDIRGRRHNESRPTLIILDDIETSESSRSPEASGGLDEWLTKSIIKAGSSDANVVFIGTTHHYNALLAKYISPSQAPGWTKRVYRAVISFAERQDLWTKWENIYVDKEKYNGASGEVAAKRYYNDNEKDMLKGVKLLWPEFKSYYELMVMKLVDGDISFYCEMQNDPVSSKDCVFNINDVQYWDDKYNSVEELLRAKGGDLLIYGACDPSLGKDREAGDYSAIVIAAISGTTGNIYVLDEDLARVPPDMIMERILQYNKMRHVSRFGLETNNFQELMVKELKDRADALNQWIVVDEIKNTSNKQIRIENLQPMIKSGKIKFSRKHRMLLEELRFYPKCSHDDALDALQMVVTLAYDKTAIIRHFSL